MLKLSEVLYFLRKSGTKPGFE